MPGDTHAPEKLSGFLHSQAQAALVAVDMLALAALMKAMGYLEVLEHQLSLVAIVFMTVCFICLFVGGVGAKALREFSKVAESSGDHGERALQWLIITIRLAEPAFIFYFVLDLMSFLIFERKFHSVGFVFGSILLLFGLVRLHGLIRIVETCVPGSRDGDQFAGSPPRPVKEILIGILHLSKRVVWCVSGFIVGLFILLVMVLLCHDDPTEFIPLDTLIGRLLSAVSFFLCFSVFLIGRVINWPFIGRVNGYIRKFFLLIAHNIFTIMFIIGALIVAAFFPIIDNLMSVAFRSGGSYSLMCPKDNRVDAKSRSRTSDGNMARVSVDFGSIHFIFGKATRP